MLRHVRTYRLAAILALVLGAATVTGVAVAAKLKGTITADGSSTVGPYTSAAAELFQKQNQGVQITVGISGTGGGFQRFCNNEIDLSDASRPMKIAEAQACKDKGVKWVPFTVANDGLSVVVNKANTWVDCLTVEQLKKIWAPGSKIDNWKDVDASFPSQKLSLFGPGTDSGTFDFFTEKINGKAKASRSDYQASENDNVLVQGVAGDKGALGYFGYSYAEENLDKLKIVKVNGGNGCVAPSIKTVQANTYRPLSRPLFIYAKRPSFQRAEVRAFIGYIFDNEKSISKKAGFISLTDPQLKKARYWYRHALKSVKQK
jgi:phosphate transport system substrate-binding protein